MDLLACLRLGKVEPECWEGKGSVGGILSVCQGCGSLSMAESLSSCSEQAVE